MPKLYQGNTQRSGFVGNRATAEDFGSNIGIGLQQIGGAMAEKEKQEEDFAYASDLVDFKLNAKRTINDLANRTTYDANEQKYNVEGVEVEDGEDFYGVVNRLNSDSTNEFLKKWGNKPQAKFDLLELRESNMAFAVAHDAKIKTAGKVAKLETSANEYSASVERGESTGDEARSVLYHMVRNSGASPEAQENAISGINDTISNSEFNYIFNNSAYSAYEALADGEFDDVSPQYRDAFLGKIERYAATETKNEIEKLKEANQYLTPYSVDPELVALHEAMGNEVAAETLRTAQSVHDDGMALLDMNASEVSAELSSQYEQALLRDDIAEMERIQAVMQYNDRKVAMITSDPASFAAIQGVDMPDFPADPSQMPDFINAARDLRVRYNFDNKIPMEDIPLLGERNASAFVSTVDSLNLDDKITYIAGFANNLHETEFGGVGSELMDVSGNMAFALLQAKNQQYDGVQSLETIKGLLLGNTLDVPRPDKAEFKNEMYKLVGDAMVDNLGVDSDKMLDAVIAVYQYDASKAGSATNVVDPEIFEKSLDKVAGKFITNGSGVGTKAPGFRLHNGQQADPSDVRDALDYYGDIENRDEFAKIHKGNIPWMEGDEVDLGYMLRKATPVPTQAEGVYTFKTAIGTYYKDSMGNPFEVNVRDLLESYNKRPTWKDSIESILSGDDRKSPRSGRGRGPQ